MVCAHIYYSGRVQGVGFRYTTQIFANELKLSGWVKNLNDGRVEILVEGKQEIVSQFIKNLDEHFEHHIQNKFLEYIPSTGQYSGFQITA